MTAAEERLLGRPTPGSTAIPQGLVAWVTTTDHKKIGVLYMVTAFIFLLVAGLFSLVMRAELAVPELQFLDIQLYNELFTMHGTAMLFFFATPMVVGLANYLIPLQIGAPDVAFPRLNAFTFWLFLFSALVVFSGFFITAGAASFGWYAYPPLSTKTYSPGLGSDLWVIGILFSGVATILGAVNIVATIFSMRAPGLTMLRLPLFSWNILVTAALIMFTFPVLGAALAMLFIDRNLGGTFFTTDGQPLVYQHLFWFFGHPEVYIIALPFFGVVTEIIPVFSRKPLFGYRAFVFATILIGAYSFSVWAHHMFTTGAVATLYFAVTSFLIAIPTGVKFFGWIATMWRGNLWFATPMLYCCGMLATFLIGGITGVFLASPPIDYAVHDTYYVVAHMHYVLMPTSVFALFGGLYYWFPKFTGRMLDERIGKIQFWLLFIGFNLTFLPMHQVGLDGMPRRIADYAAGTGWQTINMISTAGSLVIGLSMALFVWNFVTSLRYGPPAGPNPWGAHTLEWATSSPPPHHNFTELPPITSDRPLLDQRRERQAADSDTAPEERPPSRSQEDRRRG